MWFVLQENGVPVSFRLQFVAVFDQYSQQQLVAYKYLYPPEPKINFKKVIFTHVHACFQLSRLPGNVCILNNCSGRKCWGFQVISKAAVFPSPPKAANKTKWIKQGLCASWRASIQIFRCIHYMVTHTRIMAINLLHFCYWSKGLACIPVLTNISIFTFKNHK